MLHRRRRSKPGGKTLRPSVGFTLWLFTHPTHVPYLPTPPPAPLPIPIPPTPGYIDGIDDPGMGWARYAQTVRIFVLNSGLFFMRASPRSVRAAASLSLRALSPLRLLISCGASVLHLPSSSCPLCPLHPGGPDGQDHGPP